MILSNVRLQEALKSGSLVIEPRPQPDFPSDDNIECPYQTSAVDLRLGDEILCFRKKLPVSIDLRVGGFSALADAISERWRFPQGQPYTLKHGEFVLGRTLERIALPIAKHTSSRPCLAARIEGRSSYSRCGLLVHFTAPTIHAGYDGIITLEICNFGPYSIELHKGACICQLIVEEVAGIPFRNDSQFHGQRSPDGTVDNQQ